MKFLIECRDKPGTAALRAENQPAHRAYLASIQPKLIRAGALVDATGARCGSVLIAELADWSEAERVAAEEPYAKAGAFASVSICEYRLLYADGALVA